MTSWQLRETICYFSLESVVPVMHGQNIVCSKTHLDFTTHEQTIFVGSHLQVTSGLLAIGKEEKNVSNDN